MSDTLENTDRETKRETKHTHTRCLGHRRGLAATTAQVRDSELQESVAPSAAQSVHRALCGMGRLRTQGERSGSLSSRHLKAPAPRRETKCLQITVVETTSKGVAGLGVRLCKCGALGGSAAVFPHLYPHEERDAPGSGALIAADAKIQKTRLNMPT